MFIHFTVTYVQIQKHNKTGITLMDAYTVVPETQQYIAPLLPHYCNESKYIKVMNNNFKMFKTKFDL